MHMMQNLVISTIITILVLGGPFTLFALIKMSNSLLGKPKARFVKSPAASEAPLAIMVDWDNESFPQSICRVKVEYTELVQGGRSTSFSFTMEDKSAKKKSFMIPMKLSQHDLQMLTDGEQPSAQIFIEIENTAGQVVRKKLNKAQLIEAMAMGARAPSADIDALPAQEPDNWSVFSRVFPWRNIVPVAEAAAGEHKEKKKSAAPKDPAAFNFLITKVWIEPGCIVCDACENEAPDVFQVLADTCIVRDKAPMDNVPSIVAAAEGCPVDVIKYSTKPK